MMKAKLVGVLGAVALLLSPLASASAQWGLSPQNAATGGADGPLYCGGSNFSFCFKANSWNSGSDSYIWIYNMANSGSTAGGYALLAFKGVGFNKLPVVPTITAGFGPGTKYSFGTNVLNGDGAPAGSFDGADADPPPTSSGALFGEYVQFKFVGKLLSDWASDAYIGIHAISGPLDLASTTGARCSSKLYVNVATGEVVNNVIAAKYADCGGSVVPEPASLALVATGMLGLGLVATRRRSV